MTRKSVGCVCCGGGGGGGSILFLNRDAAYSVISSRILLTGTIHSSAVFSDCKKLRIFFCFMKGLPFTFSMHKIVRISQFIYVFCSFLDSFFSSL